jgi:hypothetical protein
MVWLRVRRGRIAQSPNDWQCVEPHGIPPKKTQKVKPQKKIPETDAIFENVAQANQQKDELADYQQQWHPSESLPKWDVKIIPT